MCFVDERVDGIDREARDGHVGHIAERQLIVPKRDTSVRLTRSADSHSLLRLLLVLAQDVFVCGKREAEIAQCPKTTERNSESGRGPLISSLYGRSEPVGAETRLMSTALVICAMAVQLSALRIDWYRYYLPRLDHYPNPRSHEDHPARLFIVVDQVE